MKRKLIKYEVFQEMKEKALSSSVKELVEAESYLSDILNTAELKLNSFDPSTVIYESADGSFVRANYQVDESKLHFTDVEQIVIDEETERQESRKLLANMVEAILEDKTAAASELFEKHMDIASSLHKREQAVSESDTLEESVARQYGTRGKTGRPKISYRTGSKNPRKVEAARKGHHRHPDARRKAAAKRKRHAAQNRARLPRLRANHGKLRALSGGTVGTGKRKRHMNEWAMLTENVFGYIDYVQNRHVFNESSVETSKNGAVSVVIPTTKVRNEGKVLMMQFDVLKTDVKILRETARHLVQDSKFCQAIAEVKRQNNLSDHDELEKSISNLVAKFPSVLYLTQEELAHVVHEALDRIGVINYSDETCVFMAEGILRFAHGTYGDRVSRILKVANKTESKESEDSYTDFQNIVKEFYPTLDESIQIELKMFSDLFETVDQVRKIAIESQNAVVRDDAQEFLEELDAVINGRQIPSLELASDVADWLETLIETNLETADWDVEKHPHHTVNGDHPQMSKNAHKGYTPSSDFSGDWGDVAPVSDGKSYKGGLADEMRSRSWGNKGGNNVWPDLQNPYVPSPFGDYTMKGEQGADKDSEGLGVWQDGSDTWPGLNNPYILKSVMPKQKVQPDNAVEP